MLSNCGMIDCDIPRLLLCCEAFLSGTFEADVAQVNSVFPGEIVIALAGKVQFWGLHEINSYSSHSFGGSMGITRRLRGKSTHNCYKIIPGKSSLK